MVIAPLPTDILLGILIHLDVKDILNFGMASKQYHELSKSRFVWDYLFRQNIFEENIPVPGLAGRPVTSLSALELEYYYQRSLALRKNWHSHFPATKCCRRLPGTPHTRIVSLHVLPGRQGCRWLVSLAMAYGQQRKFTIKCWDIRPPNPICVAQREYDSLTAIAVNKSACDAGCIAVLVPNGIEILALDLNAGHPNRCFVTSRRISIAMSDILGFQGRRLILKDSDRRLFLLNLDNPQIKIEFQHTTATPIDFVLTDTFVLILKTKTFELYPLPSSLPSDPRHIVISPIFAFQWPWRVDFGVMTLRHSHGDYSTNKPITIFVRFGSGFPWAVHQYEVRPNAYFLSSEPPSEMNVPYEFPPALSKSIGSPVRQHAPTDLAIGAYGTAVWIDTKTENYYHQPGRGQRIAGVFASLTGTRQDSGSDTDEEDEDARGQIHIGEAPFVYAHHEEDSWSKVALDEEEGVIFLGRADGAIDVLEYAQ